MEEPGKVTWTVDPTVAPTPCAYSRVATAVQVLAPYLAASVTDPDAVVSTSNDTGTIAEADITSWKWYRSSSRSATGTLVSGETDETYSVSDRPTNNDIGSYIRVEATYRESDTSSTKTVTFTSENPVLGARGNQSPSFVSPTVNRRIAENAAVGAPVGGPITASDSDGDVLTYSILAATPNFAINPATGQLTVKAGANLNHDAGGGESQDVTVTVTDPSGSATDITTVVTIAITDVNEAPGFVDADSNENPQVNPSVVAIMENATGNDLRVGNYSAIDPDGDSPSLSLMGADADVFQLAANTAGADAADTVIRIVSFKASPDFDMPGDSNRTMCTK